MRRILTLAAMFVVGGVGGVFFDRVAVPQLAGTRAGNWIPALRRTAERTTIINKTEVVRVEESQAIPDLAERVKNAVVPVELYPIKKPRTGATSGVLRTGLAFTNDGLVLVAADSAEISTSASVVINGASQPMEYVGSDTSTHFMLFRTSERRFSVLPFADGTPRLGERVFALSAELLGESITQKFSASILAALAPSTFVLSEDTAPGAILVDFEGRIVGMRTEDSNGEALFIPAGELHRIGETLLRN